MYSPSYTTRATHDVEVELSKLVKSITSKAKTPLDMGYRPELDPTDELDT